MPKKSKSYKTTEKWWLGLTIVFYLLYNLPGIPEYGDAPSALIHGVLTILPLWVISYAGLIILNRQRSLRTKCDSNKTLNYSDKEDTQC